MAGAQAPAPSPQPLPPAPAPAPAIRNPAVRIPAVRNPTPFCHRFSACFSCWSKTIKVVCCRRLLYVPGGKRAMRDSCRQKQARNLRQNHTFCHFGPLGSTSVQNAEKMCSATDFCKFLTAREHNAALAVRNKQKPVAEHLFPQFQDPGDAMATFAIRNQS